ncbi:ABC transporter substrate-binding protein [Salinispira pacifica]|uniref:ABC-type Fe3+-siderophore transport system, periplasmic iron-binding component n=1 Tax=Salinispira pacifica TaxID=1307761 RepID=V5WJW1_9SPIO|nr:ABC transporter substrate-binding protein [Salinispira pacifica]AHC16087.1 ABC-type Fe3+-siderophore transport system, periplasmic iron-binding component [Salinispira pacifica]
MQFRSFFVVSIIFIFTAFPLFASGSGESGTSAGEGAQSQTSEAAETQGDESSSGNFPVEISHSYGATVVETKPRRVVSIGYSEQDPILALGYTPVALRYWFGDYPNSVWPWAQDELGSGEPEVLQMAYGELDFERIASLEPDVIIATHAGISAEEYDTLSVIAPTIPEPEGFAAFSVPWQEQTRVIARALGENERGETVISRVEEQIRDVARRNPDFQDQEIVFASPAQGQGQFWVFSPDTPPLRFLTSMGFSFPEELRELVGDKDAAQISGEQVRLLNTDVLVLQMPSWEAYRELLENDLFSGLEVASEGRIIPFFGSDDPLYGALSFSTVLSLSYAAEEFEELLQAASDGNPQTAVAR